ncbi:hypothetical protein [Burkholderia sp. LMU1-1-1.1]|uniref:hypothetical protein n=1 Tax=Burkholderia sp. LMU1-1-1.1 TaxID=3135266 RepID=UPI0028EF5FC5|nr:hypothetical protein [uncultured Duganella sp.]
MQKEIAKEVNTLMLEFSARLNDSIRLVQQGSSKDEFENYREEVSKLMTIMYLDIMKPIHQRYPELEPDALK